MSDSHDSPKGDDSNLPALGKKLLWADNPRQVTLLLKCLAALCGVLFLLDFVIHRHAHFSLERWYGFYGVAGFIAFTLIVLGAKNLRRLIGRDEAYYAPQAVDAEAYPEEELDRLQNDGTRMGSQQDTQLDNHQRPDQ